jgi:hypothetical protein
MRDDTVERLVATVDALSMRALALEHMTVTLWGLSLRNNAERDQILIDLRQMLMRAGTDGDASAGVAATRLLDALEAIACSVDRNDVVEHHPRSGLH